MHGAFMRLHCLELVYHGGQEETEKERAGLKKKALDDESINGTLLFNDLEYRGKR